MNADIVQLTRRVIEEVRMYLTDIEIEGKRCTGHHWRRATRDVTQASPRRRAVIFPYLLGILAASGAPEPPPESWGGIGLPRYCTLEQYEAVPFYLTAGIQLPLSYDNPATPAVETISFWQTPSYKLVQDGKELWFRDHFVTQKFAWTKNQKPTPWPLRPGLDGVPRPKRTLYFYADAYGIPREEISKKAYVFMSRGNEQTIDGGEFRPHSDDEAIQWRDGMDGVQMVTALGGRRHFLHYESAEGRIWLIPPTRVPASAPVPSPVPPEFAASPILDGMHDYSPDSPEYDLEDVTAQTELVDVGTRWDHPATPGEERFRVWRGVTREFWHEDYPAPALEWDHLGFSSGPSLHRAWFLISEADTLPNPSDPLAPEAKVFGGDPWGLPIGEAMKLALEDVRAELKEWYDNKRKRDLANGKLGQTPGLGEKYGSKYRLLSAELVFRNLKGRRVTLWYVKCKADESQIPNEDRFVLMDGHVIRPTWVNVPSIISERLKRDPAAADALTKQRQETYDRWQAELKRIGIRPGRK